MVPYVRLGYWRWLQLPDFYGTRRSDSLFDPFSSTTGGLFWIDEKEKEETLNAKKKNIKFKTVVIKDETFKTK